jgi:hypothetical protein
MQSLVIYDETDTDMIDLLKASIEQAAAVRTQEDALEWIGRRGPNAQQSRENHMRRA